MILRNNHSLFWIPLQYWGIISGIIGTIVLAQNSIWAAIVASVILLSIIVLRNLKKNDKINISNSNMPIDIPKEKTENLEKVIDVIETEEEKQQRKVKKEDHSRFMPK